MADAVVAVLNLCQLCLDCFQLCDSCGYCFMADVYPVYTPCLVLVLNICLPGVGTMI